MASKQRWPFFALPEWPGGLMTTLSTLPSPPSLSLSSESKIFSHQTLKYFRWEWDRELDLRHRPWQYSSWPRGPPSRWLSVVRCGQASKMKTFPVWAVTLNYCRAGSVTAIINTLHLPPPPPTHQHNTQWSSYTLLLLFIIVLIRTKYKNKFLIML